MKRVKKSAPKQRSCRVLAMHVGAIVPFTSVGCLASRVRTCWASGAMSGKRTTRSTAKNGVLLYNGCFCSLLQDQIAPSVLA